MVRLISAIAVVGTIVATLLMSGAAHAQPTKIRISWTAMPINLPPLFMEKPELMTRVGQSYTIDAIRLPDTAQSVAALAAGELDIALLTFSSLPAAIQNTKLEDLRIISDEFIDGAAGHYSAEFLVLKDGPIQKIEDLRGKTVAVDVRRGGADIALRAIAKKHGLDEKRDFTRVEVAFVDMKATLLEKKADLIALGVPAFSADATLRSQARSLFTQRDALGQTAQMIWVAREGFLQRNRAAMVDFMADALRMRRFFIDPKNRNEAVSIVSHVTKQPREQLRPWLFSKDDFYRSPDGVLDISMLQNNIKSMVDLGFLKSGVDAKKYQDFSIVKEAAERLK